MALQRLRAALKLSILWLVGGSILGGVLGAAFWFFSPGRRLPNMNYPFWEWVSTYAFALGVSGFLAGAVFALLLSQRAKSSGVNRLSYLRIAGWGALAGAISGAAANAGLLALGGTGTRIEWVLGSAAICAIASLGAASGVLAMARRAPELPGEREGAARLSGSTE